MTNAPKKVISIKDNRIDIISDINLTQIPEKNEKLSAHCTILCTEGEATLYLNNKLLNLKEGDLLVATIGSVIQGKNISDNFRACGFYMTREFFEELSNIPLGYINAAIYIAENPLMHLNDHAVTIFKQYYELIKTKLGENNSFKHHQLVTDFLFQAFMYEFHDICESFVDVGDFKFSCGENLYRQFIELVLHSYPKPRSVEWYAEKLSVTPKYLSSVAKQCSGKTASAIINHYVLEDVKRSLMRPDKTIKEIVNELDFPSISFFGKYCKKNLGMSPKFYRINKGENV